MNAEFLIREYFLGKGKGTRKLGQINRYLRKKDSAVLITACVKLETRTPYLRIAGSDTSKKLESFLCARINRGKRMPG